MQRYTWLPDVTLLERDAPANPLKSGATQAQTATGAPEADGDGERRASIIIPPETYATAVLPDDTRVPLPNITVRAQEYTVGDIGCSAMPGTLPPTSAYTYAVDLSIDEAIELGAERVEFTKPVAFYVENFLDFPVGSVVPTGSYAPSEQLWLAEPSGTIVEIVSIDGGRAELDIDGDGDADSSEALAELGIRAPELAELATLYDAGQSLWRVGMTHFSQWDHNWPFAPPEDAEPPSIPEPPHDTDEDCQRNGSIVHCESQTLGEVIGIVGTPYALVYSSRRAPGYRASYTVDLPITGDSVPEDVKFIQVELEVAGQRETATYTPKPNRRYSFEWDGKDGFGRPLQSGQPAKMRVGYAYDGVYTEGNDGFAAPGGVPITGSRTRKEVTLWQELEFELGGWNARAFGLGGFSLNVLHAYDPVAKKLYLGDGGQRSAHRTPRTVSSFETADAIGNADGLVMTSDGELFVSDDGRRLVLRIDADGDVSVVAGNGEAGLAESGPATETPLSAPQGIAISKSGTIYVSDFNEHVVYAIEDGNIALFAGGGDPEDFAGDGRPATQARLRGPDGLAIGADGSLYVAELIGHRVRRIAPDGTISTFAGGGSSKAEGALATQANLSAPSGLVSAPDGSLYISEREGHRIRRVGPHGRIETVAGTGKPGFSGDDGLALQAKLSEPRGMALGPDGALYVADQGNDRVRRIESTGRISSVVGGGSRPATEMPAATNVHLSAPDGLAFASDGSLFIATEDGLVRVTPELPGLGLDDIVLPSESGELLYVFDGRGKHLSTRDAFSNVTLLEFEYNERGQPTAIIDRDGLRTSIERNDDGTPTTIVGPYGHETGLEVDSDGLLTVATDPMGEHITLEYAEGGLLTSFTETNGGQHEFSYDALGRLISDRDPGGFTQQLTRAENTTGFEVRVETPLGRTMTYALAATEFGTERSVTGIDGHTATLEPIDATTTRFTTSDGTRIERTLVPDPRWGMLAPYASKVTLTTPSGRTLTAGTQRFAELSDASNPLSLVRFEEITSIGDRSWRSVYDASEHRWTHSSPEGRGGRSVHDELGRVVLIETPERAPVHYDYDKDGRVEQITVGDGTGARVTTLGYGSDGFLSSERDATGREWFFQRDANGRLLAVTRPDGDEVGFSYDVRGLLATVTPAGRPAHSYDYSPAGLLERYSPPDVDGDTTATRYEFDADNRYTATRLPDGRSIELTYDEHGRPETLSIDAGDINVQYRDTDGSVELITAPNGDTLGFAKDGPLETGLSWTGNATGALSVEYDDDFQIASKQIAELSVAQTYDADGLLTQVGALDIIRSPDTGYIQGTSFGLVSTTQSFDQFAQLSSQTASAADTSLYEVHFEHDAAGRIISLSEVIDGDSFEKDFVYDDLGRLVSETVNAADPVVYTFDANGNRTSITGGPAEGEIVYDAQDRLVSYGSWVYTHSAEGDLMRRDNGDQFWDYQFNEFGALESVTTPSGTVISYGYDPQGRRSVRYVDGTFDYALIYEDDLRPAAKLDAEGNVIERYVYGTQLNSPDYIVRGGEALRIIHDYLGSVRLIVAEDGDIEQRIDYDSYGNVIQGSVASTPFGFAGGLHDPDTGLVRFGARDYDPETGRWLTKDPSGLSGGLNLYQYANSDPVNTIDVDGESPIFILFACFLRTRLMMAIRGAAIGAIEGAALQTALELAKNGGNIDCVDWGAVGDAALQGAGEGAIVGGLGMAPGGKYCFAPGTAVQTEHGPVPIEQVELGTRVPPDHTQCAAVDTSTWLQLELDVDQPDTGETVTVSVLRPPSWLSEHALVEGASMHLTLDELNITGPDRKSVV